MKPASRRAFAPIAVPVAFALGTLVSSTTAQAADQWEDWPSRPITLALVSPAGGATDRGLRPLAKVMQDELGVSVAVTDMSGASGCLATEWVMNQPANGYAWLGSVEFVESNAILGQCQHTYKDWWQYISSGTPVGVIVPSDSPYETFPELLQAIEEGDKKLVAATPQTGSTHNLAAVYLQTQVDDGLDFEIVPYPGGGPAARAAVTGEVDMLVIGITPAVPFIRANQLRPLVAMTKGPFELEGYGEIPPITDYLEDERLAELLPWTNLQMIALRRDTPEPILEKIDAAWVEAMANPKMDQVAADNGFVRYKLGREEADELLQRRTIVTTWLIEKILGINELTREELGIAKYEEMR